MRLGRPQEDAWLGTVEPLLGVRFRRWAGLKLALRHRSVSTDPPRDSNERLEYLGDAVLGMLVAEHLHGQFAEWDEGKLARARAALVCEPTLAAVARSIGLDRAVLLSPGEESAGGRSRPSILSDCYEAVTAAVYLDRGLGEARRFVLRTMGPWLAEAASHGYGNVPKSLLQERLQAARRPLPVYELVNETGSDHDKTFTVRVLDGDREMGEGSGKSKKQAEQAAAADALTRLASGETQQG